MLSEDSLHIGVGFLAKEHRHPIASPPGPGTGPISRRDVIGTDAR